MSSSTERITYPPQEADWPNPARHTAEPVTAGESFAAVTASKLMHESADLVASHQAAHDAWLAIGDKPNHDNLNRLHENMPAYAFPDHEVLGLLGMIASAVVGANIIADSQPDVARRRLDRVNGFIAMARRRTQATGYTHWADTGFDLESAPRRRAPGEPRPASSR